MIRMFTGGRWHEAPLYRREELGPGSRIDGPAIIAEANATTVVEPEWHATITTLNHLVLERSTPRKTRAAVGTTVDPVMLEIFNNLYMSIAEQMGLRLQNTAYSVNIKERLDFSCALFDADGNLIANAPHMPVHLGSMGESIKTVIRLNAGKMKPGDVYVLNAPYNGGTHLPDVTVITPVFDSKEDEVLFYVGSRGHHADIGGITPGSMPPGSKVVEEEGVLIDNFLLVEAGRFREQETVALLTSGKYPVRNVQQNIADLQAQIAANEKGVQELRRMVEHFGLEVVRAYMRHVQDNAEESVRRVIGVLKDGEFDYPLDNGARIRVKITIGQRPEVRKDRFHRHVGPAAEQFQRARGGVHGGGAVRLPHAGRRRHSVECRLPEAARGDHPGRLHAAPALPRGRGGRQRGDFAVHHRCALRRARGARRLSRHDEQLHLRQRALPVLRDRRRRLRRRRGLRRRRRGADAHDEFPAHRSRSARVALPGAPGELRDPPRLGRRRALARRARRGAPRAVSRADDRGDSFRPPPGAARMAWRAESPAPRAATRCSAPTAAASSSGRSTRPRWRRATRSSSRPRAAAVMAL